MGGEVYKCSQCFKIMTIVERMLGPVCGECARKNHKRVIGKGF